MDSEMLPRARCRDLFERIEGLARRAGVGEVEVMMGASSEALTRFANNAIHQNVAGEHRWVSVRVQEDGRTARATTNRLDDGALEIAVAEAIALTRAAEPDPELLPLAGPVEIRPVDRADRATADCTPASRARLVAQAIGVVEEAALSAAGICSTEESATALLNSRGVFAYHSGTLARFSITATGADSSGWAKASSVSLGAIDAATLARTAARKADLSRAPREIAAGRYTVILEPAAVLDLVGQMFADFSGTSVHDQRSFLTGRLGEKLFGENISIADDVHHGLQDGAPFDGEGMARTRLALVEAGTPRGLCYGRGSARRAGVEPTGHGLPLPNEAGEMAVNIVISGGDSSIERMIASTSRGILVTRFWYIREVDPYEKIMTGMTRDGTFLIEGGELVCGLRNFRFNQGLVEMLRRVEMLGEPVRASGEEAFDMVAPAMKVGEFHFSEVTRF